MSHSGAKSLNWQDDGTDDVQQMARYRSCDRATVWPVSRRTGQQPQSQLLRNNKPGCPEQEGEGKGIYRMWSLQNEIMTTSLIYEIAQCIVG